MKKYLLAFLAFFASAAHADTQLYPCFTTTANLLTCLISNYSIVWPLHQGSAGTTLVNDGSGNLVWGASGASIGTGLAGGNVNSILYVGSGPVLAQDPNFVYTGTSVGIGTSAPAARLDVAGGFQVNSLGNIIAIRAVPTSFPNTQGAAGSVLQNDGSGGLAWTPATSANTAGAIVQRGGSGDFSAGTITAALNGNATNVTGVVSVAHMAGPAASGTSGYLASGDWVTFNNKVTSVAGSPPVASSGGLTPTISMHVADVSDDGYLASGDWATFNGRVASVSGTAPVVSSGGQTPAISMHVSDAADDGYLASGDWATFNGKVTSVSGTAPVVSSGGATPAISMHIAGPSNDGYLSSSDWQEFNLKQQAITVSPPLTFTADNVAIPQSSNVADGYLSSGDWAIFNGKQPAGSYLTGNFTAGSVPFSTGGTATAENNSNFYWNNSSHSLGLGTNSNSDTVAGTDVLKATINGTTYGFSDGGGANAGFFSISNGTITGFGGHTSTAEAAVVFGAFSNHAAVLRSGGNVSGFRLGINGNVGISSGISSDVPSLLSVGTGSPFQVNSSGNIVKTNNVTTSWPSSQGGANTYLKNDGSGNFSWNTVASGITIGDTVTNGVSRGVLFVDPAGKLANDASRFSWDSQRRILGAQAAFHGDTTYALIGGGSGLYVSRDNGVTFGSVLSTGSFVEGVFSEGPRMYAGTGSNGLYTSTDSGMSWAHNYTSGTTGLTDNEIRDVFALGKHIYLAGNAFAYSDDDGTTWHAKTTGDGLGSGQVLHTFAGDGLVYAATTGGLSISSNGGSSFTNHTSMSSVYISGLQVVAGAIYIGEAGSSPGNDCLERSTDGGATWTALDCLPHGQNINAIALANNQIFYIDNNGVVHKSPDGGATWGTLGGAPSMNASLKAYPYLDTVALYGTHGSFPGSDFFYVSLDAGATWTTYTPATDMRGLDVFKGLAGTDVSGDGDFAGLAYNWPTGTQGANGTVLTNDGTGKLSWTNTQGSCQVSSTTVSTTASNLTCTGVPASADTSVTCSGAAAFSTSTANGLYCRATGTLNQIACNTAVTNTTAMAYRCKWAQ